MTKQELQGQINFLFSELKRLREDYNNLSDEALKDRHTKNNLYVMWREADEKVERYVGILLAIKELSDKVIVDTDYRINAISKLINYWYESEYRDNNDV